MTNQQHPIGSGFGPASTTAEVIRDIDLRGKVAIVTGGYSGLGLEVARSLLGAGAEVIVPARTLSRARSTVPPGVELKTIDLMSPASIDAFANEFLSSGRQLDFLVNSAGIMATPLLRDERGYESQFSTNHLGHFQLAVQLWPALQRASGARVVAFSSRGHQLANLDFDDPNFERRPYEKWIAYGQSKTANILFALGLDARGRGDGIRAFAVHPGTIFGDLARHLSAEEIRSFGVLDEEGHAIVAPERDLKTVEQGAATAVWCATSAQLGDVGGVYCEDCDVANVAPAEGRIRYGVKPWAVNEVAAERLWRLSEQLVGVALD